MPRALEQIIKELDSVYSPQRDIYNKSLQALPQQQEGELKGLEAAKTDSFGQIVTGANRRGVAFGGIPLEEQAKYLGASYLPAVANLKNRFTQQDFNIRDALAQIGISQRKDAQNIWDTEYTREEEKRQFDLRMAAEREAASRAAAASGGGGGGNPYYDPPTNTGDPAPQESMRQRWQREASAGDWNAQVALNYAGDDGNYDGHVNSLQEYNVLKSLGITGNYYVPGLDIRRGY